MVALVAVLVVVGLMFAFGRGAMARPTIAHDYGRQIQERALARQEAVFGPGLNQWDQFRASLGTVRGAVEWLEQYNKDLPVDPDDTWRHVTPDLIYIEPDGGTPEQFERARGRALEVLARWEAMGVFEAARAIAGLERVARPFDDRPLFDQWMSEGGTARGLARALAARARLAARAGDDAARLEAVAHTLALGRVVGGSGLLIDHLVGTAIMSLARNELLHGLLLHPVEDDAWLRAADELLRLELEGRASTMADALRTERLFIADTVQRAYTDDGAGGGRLLPFAYAQLIGYDEFDSFSPLTPLGMNRLSNVHGDLFLGRKALDHWLDELLRLSLDALEATGPAIIGADRRVAEHMASADWRNPIGRDLLSSIHVLLTDRLMRIEAAGARVVLAIERYRLANGGRPPATLEDLGPLLPDGLLADPVTGQPWDYEPTALTLDEQGRPLLEGAAAWPFTLRSRPWPEAPSLRSGSPSRLATGVLITVPIQGPKYDAPLDDWDSWDGHDAGEEAEEAEDGTAAESAHGPG